jgi:AcrR family transcriptional regulator
MPRVVDHEAERARLLGRAFDAIAATGWDGMRMRPLAKHCGVSVGKLYHYFPDREALGAALFQWAGTRDVTLAVQRLSGGETRQQRMDLLLEFVAEHGDQLSTTLLLALDHQRHHGGDAVQSAVVLYRRALTEQIGLEPDQADLLFTVLLGLLVRSQLQPTGRPDLNPLIRAWFSEPQSP